MFFLDVLLVEGVVGSVGSGWVRPAPKRDRRVPPCFRGLFWEVEALGSVVAVVVVALALGGFLRRVWEAGGGCRRVELLSFGTLEEETALS